MRPILFVVPGWEFKIHSYGVMILLACFAALAIGVWRARRDKIDPNVVYELATWLFLGGVVGARGVYVLSHLESIHSLGDILRSWQGGNVFYGCILGGLTGSILYWFRRPFPFWLMTDVAAPAVAIGIAIGRIGCFLNGCCYGAVCDQPWAVCFPGRVARLGSPGRRRLDFTVGDDFAAGASHADLCVARRVCPARLAAGVFPPPPRRRRGDGRAHDRLPADALAAGSAAWRRAGHFRRHDLVAEYQRCPVRVRAGACGLACAGGRAFTVGTGRPSPPARSPVRFRLGVGVGPGTGTRTSRRGRRIGVKRRPVEKVPRAQVKTAPHEQGRAFPGVVARPEPRAGVGLAVLMPRLVMDRRVGPEHDVGLFHHFLIFDDVRQVGEDKLHGPLGMRAG